MASENQCGDPEVANPWDKGPEPTDQLPNSELSPLLNPTLGRNLGRWAQVYFTSPPEKREEAVEELLRELENETPATAASENRSAEKPAKGARLQPEVLCPGCQHKNEANQRFCGNCGYPLSAGSAPHVRGSNEAFAQSPTAALPAPSHTGSDVQWLRDKALFSLEESGAPAHRGWKYLIVGLVILLAGFAYLQWAAQPHRAPTPPPSAAAIPAPTPQPQLRSAEPAQAAQQPPPEQVPSVGKTPTAQTSIAARENMSERPAETNLTSSAQKHSAVAESAPVFSPQAGAGAGSGAQELLLAQGYLEGRAGPRDTTEAAKWLWRAVGKQNTGATLLLADLYAHGDGVPRSCDQARLLLVAAVKKGAPQAAQKLRSLESNGCQ